MPIVSAKHKGPVFLIFRPFKSQQQEARNQKPGIKIGETGYKQ
jgi:hypothetical protein